MIIFFPRVRTKSRTNSTSNHANPMNSTQIAALKYLIFKSPNAGEMLKKLLALLIDRSENLQKEVCVTLVENEHGFTAEEIGVMARDMNGLHSCNGQTHLNECMALSGSGFTFSVHYGDFDASREPKDRLNNDGQFEGFPTSQVVNPRTLIAGTPLRYTFWLARENYSDSAESVTLVRYEIDEIDLKKPGLYPDLER